MAIEIVDRLLTLPAVNQMATGFTSPRVVGWITQVDDMACSGFDRLVENVPFLLKPLPDIWELGRNYMGWNLGSEGGSDIAMEQKRLTDREKMLDEKEKNLDDRENRLERRKNNMDTRDGQWTLGLRKFASDVIKTSYTMTSDELDQREMLMNEREKSVDEKEKEMNNSKK